MLPKNGRSGKSTPGANRPTVRFRSNKHVARLSFLHIDRPRQNVPARSFVRHLRINLAQRLRNLTRRNAHRK